MITFRQHQTKIVSQYFYNGYNNFSFDIKQLDSGEMFKLSALEILYSDSLFSPIDIWTIVYFAAYELFLTEKEFIKSYLPSLD